MKTRLVLFSLTIILFLVSCKEEDRNVTFFKNTEAYNLSKAVEGEDLDQIEKLVKNKPKLLEMTNSISGSNVLGLALTLENFETFKKLLELGADPNFINPITKRSILIDACKFYSKPKPYTIDLKYIKLLLRKGAHPNYVIENDFTDDQGNYHTATSALIEASTLDLSIVKTLIKAGADPYKKLNQNSKSPFSNSLQGDSSNKFEVANYFIDSLKVNLEEPIAIYSQQPSNKEVTIYIQDEIVNKFTLAKIKGNVKIVDSLKKENKDIETANSERWKFIQKLESKGLDFKNHNYK